MIADPGARNPTNVSDYDDFSVDTGMWATAVTSGSTTAIRTTTPGTDPCFRILNAGAGTAGSGHLPHATNFPAQCTFSVEIEATAMTGAGSAAYLTLYKDATHYIKFGKFKSGAVDCNIHLRYNLGAGEVTESLTADAINTDKTTYKIKVTEHTALLYHGTTLVKVLPFTDLVNYELRLEGYTTDNTDTLTVYFQNVQMANIAELFAAAGSRAVVAEPETGNLTMDSTTPVEQEFTQATHGKVFKLNILYDLGCAEVDYCYQDDGGVFTDETTDARDIGTDDVNIVPAAPAINDALYIGADAAFKRCDISMVGSTALNVDNVFAWEGWTGAAWVALAGLADGTNAGTRAFEQTGKVTWTSVLASTTVNGQAGYWIRARVTTAGSVCRLSRVLVIKDGATDFDSLAEYNTVLTLKIFQKIGAAYPTYPQDEWPFTHLASLNSSPSVDNLLCQSDTKISLTADQTPTASITIPYRYTVEQLLE